MALVSCNLCENKISTRARYCPKCGCPNPARNESAPSSSKDCANCENSGPDGGYACNLCDTGAFSSFQAKKSATQQKQAAEVPMQFKGESVGDLLAQLDELEAGSYSKELYAKISNAVITSRVLGINLYAGDDIDLKYFRQLNTVNSVCSNLALLLGPFYYIFYGLWRKGALLLLLQILFSAGIVFGNRMAAIVSLVLLLLVQVISYCAAKYDRYRKHVLGEEFWW